MGSTAGRTRGGGGSRSGSSPASRLCRPPRPAPGRRSGTTSARCRSPTCSPPREVIETRLAHAAAADFVIALYNPVSRTRRETFERALAILREHRAADTPVVVARNLGRDGESVSIVALRAIDAALVEAGAIDMMTVLLVGSSRTRTFALGGSTRAYTPRGYEVRIGGAASGTGGTA